jgi:hypothetical protein
MGLIRRFVTSGKTPTWAVPTPTVWFQDVLCSFDAERMKSSLVVPGRLLTNRPYSRGVVGMTDLAVSHQCKYQRLPFLKVVSIALTEL